MPTTTTTMPMRHNSDDSNTNTQGTTITKQQSAKTIAKASAIGGIPGQPPGRICVHT